MEIKSIWRDEDFESMNWHDSRLYQIYFPDDSCEFKVFIDYIFKWVQDKESFKFWVAPCELIFHNVTNLKINLLFENQVGVDIGGIIRNKIGLTPNKLYHQWDYEIITDKGNLNFTTTGFTMNLLSEPNYSNSQDYSPPITSASVPLVPAK
jgi:hypothetical protein